MKAMFKKIYRFLRKCRFNYVKTLEVNFMLLPLRQAIKLPIVVYTPCETLIRRSRLVISDGTKLKFGMIALGRNDDKFECSKASFFFMMLDSIINVSGEVRFSPGCTIRMDHSTLNLGCNSAFGGGGKLLCNNIINIGDYVQFAFGCVCSDTDYHFISMDGKVKNCTSPVIIGDRSWIGNNCTVGKGTVLPPSSILAAKSMANKDYSGFGEGALFAGSPARCLRTNCYRIHNTEIETRIHNHYKNTTETYHILDDEFEKSQYR